MVSYLNGTTIFSLFLWPVYLCSHFKEPIQYYIINEQSVWNKFLQKDLYYVVQVYIGIGWKQNESEISRPLCIHVCTQDLWLRLEKSEHAGFKYIDWWDNE